MLILSVTFFLFFNHAQGLNVLFLGNSYTYVNDVPNLVENLAKAEGLTLTYGEHTGGGWTLEKHWNSDKTLNLIRDGNWDVVIIQEQSRRTSDKPKDVCQNSFTYANLLADEVHKHNPEAKIQWYLTWGRPFGDDDRCQDIPQVCTFDGMQDAITETYSAYGCMFKPGQVAPVGEGFRQYKLMLGEAEFSTLYNTNGVSDHHASLKGSYLSACAHFSTLFGRKCLGNSYTAGLPHETTVNLQMAADAAIDLGKWSFPGNSQCNNFICQ